jgi:phosphoglycerate dehydrogenase-like enzyme
VKANPKLRWIQLGQGGVEKELVPELVKSDIAVTSLQKLRGPNVGDHAMALVLALARGPNMPKPWLELDPKHPEHAVWEKAPIELHKKTMLIVGMGGAGRQIARRAEAFGMRVMAIESDETIIKPAFVFSLDRPDKVMDLLPKADVVVLACPLSKESKGMFGKEQFAAMKKSAIFINVARSELVDQKALIVASPTLKGVGLDVTDPKSPVSDTMLKNVIISPNLADQSDAAPDRQWRLFRENVRRFVAGEPLLCVVDKQREK